MRVVAILGLCTLVGGCHRIWPYDQTRPAGDHGPVADVLAADGPTADGPTAVDGPAVDAPAADAVHHDVMVKIEAALPCSATCAGCCKPDGTCLSAAAQDTYYCGKNGDPCAPCPPGQVCQAGACVADTCGPGSCPLGCCDVNDNCVPQVAALRHLFCGSGGATCQDCVSKGQYCSLLTNKCTSPLCGICAGCCTPGSAGMPPTCITNTSNSQCGKYGETCQDCTEAGNICCEGVCQYGPCPT